MGDAGRCDQPCIHASLLKLRNSLGCRIKRYDFVTPRLNRQNRKLPPDRRCWRRAGNWKHRAEAFWELLSQMPGASASHAIARDYNPFFVDYVVGHDHVEQSVHRLLVFGGAPIAANRIRRDDDGTKYLERGTDDALHQVGTDAGGIAVPDPVVQRKNERDGDRRSVVGRNGDRVADPGFARTFQCVFMQSWTKRGGISYSLRGCADRQLGQKRQCHDREKRANPSKRDTSTSAVTRHHRGSSLQQRLTRKGITRGVRY